MLKKKLPLIIGSLLVVAYLMTSFFVVNEAEYSIVTRFGRTVAVHDEPGLRVKLPMPFERVVRFDKRNMYQIIPEEEFLTSDKKNIVVSSFLTWRIVDPEKFLTALRTRDAAEARIENLMKSLFGAALGQKPFTDYIPADITQASDMRAAENISIMEEKIYNEASALASRDYGIELTNIGVSKFNFPAQNLISVYARMRAERERIAKSYRSEGDAEARKVIADANRRSAEIISAAEAEAEIARGEAEAEAARIYAEAYKDKEGFYEFLRTLEVYGSIIDNDTTLILPEDSPLLDLLTNPPLENRKADR
ncbi:protease modulator HflC [Pseudemcibacter aquimaris]|uniref:protease modulator HflC n=1 Tax=Pseudemcibacter aquimaris TaxID=2857064 RepID=UPI002013B7F6|nr:protease modulator HflC [Pseudemcibacter aquimaris]MCC3860339.1 protease modulator HflC [Pseudemcibacter aquimaris]WDU57665.1 protease modulator HflC [Pseudemcibacter aquimaris]